MKPVSRTRYLFRRGNTYVFRRIVPKALVGAFGQREVHQSFGSRGLSEARLLLAQANADFESRIAAITGVASPKDVLTFSLAREPNRDEIEEGVRAWLADRLSRDVADTFIGADGHTRGAFRLKELAAHSDNVAEGIALGAHEPSLTTLWIAEAVVEKNGWRVERGSPGWSLLVRTVGRGQIEASGWQAADIAAEPRIVRDARFAPEQYRLDADRRRKRLASTPQPLLALLEDYIIEVSPAPASIKAWRRQLGAFIAYLGHDDACRVTFQNVDEWRAQLLTQPTASGKVLSTKTVRDTYLSILKTIFGWAREKRRIQDNPTEGVRVRARSKPTFRPERGLSDAEATLILRSTTTKSQSRLSPKRALARRWVPWICAYTGARVNEITQLRGRDVFERNGMWVIRITPDAGGVKNNRVRLVPLHPHLIEQGFLQAISGQRDALFYDPALHRGGSDGNPQYKKVGEYLARWVREIGVKDPEVQPSHGWRHRFTTQARLAGMETEITRAIQGHAARTEGEKYGYTPPEAMWREMQKLPSFRWL